MRILEHEAQVQENGRHRAEKYLELANTRYKGGVTSYLEVTTAQSAALSDEVTAVNILGRRMVDAVTLVQALGGGWDSSELPAPPGMLRQANHQLKDNFLLTSAVVNITQNSFAWTSTSRCLFDPFASSEFTFDAAKLAENRDWDTRSNK